jgi:SAM-dependent methyltransferase
VWEDAEVQLGYASAMHVVEVRDFYGTELGRTSARLVQQQLAGLTRPRPGQTVLGLGYALPYLPAVPDGAVLAFMLARQGVIHWPEPHHSSSALVEDVELPLLESVVDLAMVIHGLEHADSPLELLQEVWRVMAPQGRLLLVVPNRRGLWAAAEHTPFGHGEPFSVSQVETLLKDAKFSVTQRRSALYLPPLSHHRLLQAASAFDAAGSRLFTRFSGVIIMEAMKQVYAFSSGKRARRLVPRLRPVLLPAPRPTAASPSD